MMKRIEEFNICSSTLDYDLVMNPTLREAVTLAVNYQLEEYESETGIELNPEELVLFFYPESRCKLMEIRKKNG